MFTTSRSLPHDDVILLEREKPRIMEEILSFGAPEKLNLAAALKKLRQEKAEKKPKSNKWSSGGGSDSDSCDEGIK